MNQEESESLPSPQNFPAAEIRQVGASWQQLLANSRLWWLTAICLIVAIGLSLASLRRSGTEIVIRFSEGHGIKPGDRLQYRGIDAGQVTTVALDDRLGGVQIHVELDPRAVRLARAGSRFWIERPQVGLARITGLETVVGAKYLGVVPGAADAPPAFEFEGVETPPVLREATASEILIRFAEGYGLAVGDVAKFRGIVVGEVTQVMLNGDLSGIEVRVRLAEGAESLARAGTQFWVERPQLTAAEIRGLETLVGGRYLGVVPGPLDSPQQTIFDGADQPPAGTRGSGGLEIVLVSPARHGLQRGAPVQYRGLRIGHVISVGLASDATSIEARVYIDPAYKRLIRESTVFWRTSGIDVSIGLSGVQLNADTLSSIAIGGVSLATPNSLGKAVTTGHRFTYHEEKQDEWLKWRPVIALGDARLPEGSSLPQPQRAVLRWNEKILGFSRPQERVAWVLPLADGRLLGPSDLLAPNTGPTGADAKLETMGLRLSTNREQQEILGPLTLLQPEPSVPDSIPRWGADQFRPCDTTEDCLLVGDPMLECRPLPAARLSQRDGYWDVDATLSLDADWHGAPVVAQRDGKIVGVLLSTNDGAKVFPVAEF